MNTKLTLSVNETVIAEAKDYAKKQGKSLSRVVEEYLKSLSGKKKNDKITDTDDLVNELRGSVKLPTDLTSYDDLLKDALLEKYLK